MPHETVEFTQAQTCTHTHTHARTPYACIRCALAIQSQVYSKSPSSAQSLNLQIDMADMDGAAKAGDFPAKAPPKAQLHRGSIPESGAAEHSSAAKAGHFQCKAPPADVVVPPRFKPPPPQRMSGPQLQSAMRNSQQRRLAGLQNFKAPPADVASHHGSISDSGAAEHSSAASASLPTTGIAATALRRKRQRCATQLCPFLQHSNTAVEDKHCCGCCRAESEGKSNAWWPRHGPLCEARLHPGGKRP